MIITGARKSSTATGALALDGGTPVGSASISGPNHPEVNRFESLLAALWETEQAVAVNSGAAAIHCILHSMDIGPGDEIIVPAHTTAESLSDRLLTLPLPAADEDAADADDIAEATLKVAAALHR